MKRKARKWKMWAIVDDSGLVCRNYQAPIMWVRRMAEWHTRDYLSEYRIVKVEVREILPKRGKR